MVILLYHLLLIYTMFALPYTFQGEKGDSGKSGVPGIPGRNGSKGEEGNTGTKNNIHICAILHTWHSLRPHTIKVAQLLFKEDFWSFSDSTCI